MKDVLIINGERYRKCPYADECFEKTLRDEQFIIESVLPEYHLKADRKTVEKSLCLRIDYPVKMQFRPGDRIFISKADLEEGE